ncbi:hypothetical protein [Cytophaga sp. FL35]|uniref:hypothetical protein n=1 Tax=Cytophaga sp. FL35 TaxID=1904456 RepID=UPI0016538665|nr:hypothetical protein [Cytophaga sp. FL35]MBC6997873.1 hypothetical protein [Cytophaga sp. FL35]
MKKTMLSCLLLALFSCDDGDLQIEQVDFDSVSISNCGEEEDATETTFFFKIDGDEALILDLEGGLLANETSETGTITSAIPSSSSLTYRLFSDDVSSDYFCSNIPPIEPMVMEENTATGGTLGIETKILSAARNVKNYGHQITITGLTLVNAQGESITDTSSFNYGTFTTSVANSASLEIPFSNYSDIDSYVECLENPIEGTIRLYKTINDEFLSLDVPFDQLVNTVTENTPRSVDISGGALRYVVADVEISEDMPCSTAQLSEDINSWYYNSIGGSLKIETLAGEADENGNITYTHNFTIDSLILQLKGNGDDVDDVQLPLIENVEMGSYTTFGN